jgi:hypothetical protein
MTHFVPAESVSLVTGIFPVKLLVNPISYFRTEKVAAAADERFVIKAKFEGVSSISHCVAAFGDMGLIGHRGFIERGINDIINICIDLRKNGLEMEPNLIGRAACGLIGGSRESGSASIRFAENDTDFRSLVQKADAARDHFKFHEGEFLYWSALSLFPSHPSILVQYAHCLKEQGKLVDALVYYLDAYVYGGVLSEIEEHAIFVGNRVGYDNDVIKGWLHHFGF